MTRNTENYSHGKCMLQGKYLEGIGEGTKIECNGKYFVEEGDGNTRKKKQ